MSILSRLLRSALPVAALAFAVSPAGAQLSVVGSSAGCFGAGCSGFASSATYGSSGLSFTSQGFSTSLANGADIDLVDVGSLRLVEDAQNGITNGTFRLRLTFTSPATAPQTVFTADVDGDYSWLGYDDASIAFGGPQTISFAGGSFQLWVQDVSLNNSWLNPSDADPIQAKIYGWQSGGGSGVGSVVPEPSTYALLGTGIAALGLVARRRRNG